MSRQLVTTKEESKKYSLPPPPHTPKEGALVPNSLKV